MTKNNTAAAKNANTLGSFNLGGATNISKKPIWEDTKYNVSSIVRMYDSGKIGYWRKIQRKPVDWKKEDGIEYVTSLINGMRSGTNITLVHMEECAEWNEDRAYYHDEKTFRDARDDIRVKQVESGNKANLEWAIAEGNHRLTALVAFIKDEFALPKGTKLIHENGSEYILEEDKLFSQLQGDYRSALMSTKIPATEITGARYGQTKTMVKIINSGVAFSCAQLRKFTENSEMVEWSDEMDYKFGPILENYVASSVTAAAKLNTYVQRFLYWHKNGFGGNININDKFLDEFVKTEVFGNVTPEMQADYDAVESILTTMVSIMASEKRPLVGGSTKKLIKAGMFNTLFLAIETLDDEEVHPHCLTIDNPDEFAAKFIEIDKHLEKTVYPDTTMQVWLAKKENEGKSAKEWENHVKLNAYSKWNLWADHKLVYKKYKALRDSFKKEVSSLLDAGVLKIKNKSYFNSNMIEQMKREQGFMDPIMEEPLRDNCEAHHKKRLEYGGLTERRNGVVLNKDVHSELSKDQWKRASWEAIMQNKKLIKAALLIKRNKVDISVNNVSSESIQTSAPL